MFRREFTGAARLDRFVRAVAAGCILAPLVGCGSSDDAPPPDEVRARLLALALPANPTPPPDKTNQYADDAAAAALGKKFFFDPRFSGPLLDEANDGLSNTLGTMGETGRVSCAGCHVPDGGYVDTRSARGQISLGSGWTRRRTPTLLDVSQTSLLAWDGRRTTVYAVLFAVIESALEFNSSRLFVAQQVARLYRAEYEQVFGALPALDQHPALEAATAGCTELPDDPVNETCPHPGDADPDVTRVVVNVGKAMGAYMRLLTCGPSRFDAWLAGDAQALTAPEQAGARIFVTKGRCDTCHSGPYLTDRRFYNVGAPGALLPFTGVDNSNDRGAALGLAAVHSDPLGPGGAYSDGDDGRLSVIPADVSTLEGAFRTPGLRCLDGQPSYLHNGQLRSLNEVITLFDDGGGKSGFVGKPDIQPLGLTKEEREQLVAFLRALQGPGPDPALREAPALP